MDDNISVSGLCFPHFDIERILTTVRELGVPATTLPASLVRAQGWDRGVELIKSSGVAVAGLVGPFPAEPANHDTWEAVRTEYLEILHSARTLDVENVYSVTGPAPTARRADAIAEFADFIAPVAAHARRIGVRLSIKPTSPDNTLVSFIHTIDDVVDIHDATGMGVCLNLSDVWNDPSLKDFLENHVDLLGLVQIGDLRHEDEYGVDVVPAEGVIPLRSVLARLIAVGYTGMYDIEQFGPRIENEGAVAAARRAIDEVRRAFVPVTHA